MKEDLEYLLSGYPTAYGQEFTDHPIAKLIRKSIPDKISKVINNDIRYLIKGSAGAGNWSSIPWVAILDILITNTPQSGYYPVFIFRDDMSGFYLSLNQGVTDIKLKYNREAKEVLKIKAEDYRAQIGIIPSKFNKTVIELRKLKSTKSQLPVLYEAGNIISKFYSAYDLPEDTQLKSDIIDMLRIYESISYNEGMPTTQAEIENDEEKYKDYEDLRNFRFHKRIERNRQLSKKVKQLQGYTCKVCGLNFVDKYGVIGKKFIEAHHLKPISSLTKDRVQLDARTDFTVLCSNCHSMIHRTADPSDLEALKRLINR